LQSGSGSSCRQRAIRPGWNLQEKAKLASKRRASQYAPGGVMGCVGRFNISWDTCRERYQAKNRTTSRAFCGEEMRGNSK